MQKKKNIYPDQSYVVTVSALVLKANGQKNHLSLVRKTFDFFENFSVSFHQAIFDHSISCVLLIVKPNKSCKNSKTFARNTLSTKKKAFKNKIKYDTSKDECPNFTNFFRMPKISNSKLSNEKQKELKMKLGQLQEEISKTSLPVKAD